MLSDCADAQADLHLCCLHMAKTGFSSWHGSFDVALSKTTVCCLNFIRLKCIPFLWLSLIHFHWVASRNIELPIYSWPAPATAAFCEARQMSQHPFLCLFLSLQRSKHFWWFKNEPPHDKTNKMTLRPVKTQITLGIRPVWSSLHCVLNG